MDDESALAQAELRLERALAAPDAAGVQPRPSVQLESVTSFGATGGSTSLAKVAARAEGLVKDLADVLTHYAIIETHSGGHTICRTRIAPSGDLVTTVCQDGLTPAQVGQHGRAVMLTLASRDALLRVALLLAQAVPPLASVPASPITAPIAVRAVWLAVEELVTVTSNYHALRQEVTRR